MIALKTLGEEEPSSSRKWNIKSRNLLFLHSSFFARNITCDGWIEVSKRRRRRRRVSIEVDWCWCVCFGSRCLFFSASPFPSRRTNLSFFALFFCFSPLLLLRCPPPSSLWGLGKPVVSFLAHVVMPRWIRNVWGDVRSTCVARLM